MDLPSIADSGLQVAHLDVMAALNWPLGLSGACVLLLLLVLLSGWRNGISRRQASTHEPSEQDNDIGFGAPCPNCRSYATEARGDFEKRQCTLCGHCFELHD